jgi:pyruvate/2-oxoacid:ferredoxin oxidoreductase alpha subunit
MVRRSTRRTHKKHTTHKKRNTHKKRHTRHYRKRGGNYRQITDQTIQGTPLIDDATVNVIGLGDMSIDAFKQYMENMDRNGSRVY